MAVSRSSLDAQNLGPADPQEPRHRFSAQWITASGAPAHDPVVLRFKKEIVLDAVPAHYTVHVSADNQFVLLVNGKRIGQGPAIGDVQHWRYETYDLAPALHPGKNLLVATVWNLGDDAPIRQMSSRLGFVLDPDSPAEAAAASDSSWKARRDPGYSFLPKPEEFKDNYYVGSPGERMDGSLLDWSAANATGISNVHEWQPAVPVGVAVNRGVHSESNSWLLVPDQLPAMEYTSTTVGRVVRSSGKDGLATVPGAMGFPDSPVEIPANTSATLLLDRATMTTAFPTLTVSGGKGSRIALRYSEALIDGKGDKGNRNEVEGKHLIGVADELLPDGAEDRAYTPLDWRTWRYLQIDVTTAAQPLRLSSLTAAFTAFPFKQRAKFASDDPSLTEIWNVGWRTARLCAHDA